MITGHLQEGYRQTGGRQPRKGAERFRKAAVGEITQRETSNRLGMPRGNLTEQRLEPRITLRRVVVVQVVDHDKGGAARAGLASQPNTGPQTRCQQQTQTAHGTTSRKQG